MQKLRMAILLESPVVDAYVGSFYKWAASEKLIDVAAVVVDNRDSHTPGASQHVHQVCHVGRRWRRRFEALLWPEEWLLRIVGGVTHGLPNEDVSKRNKTKFFSPYSNEVPSGNEIGPAALLALKIDIFVMFGACPSQQEIFACAQLGGLAVDFACGHAGPGAPPGFWEVFYALPTTSVCIKAYAKSGYEGETVLYGSFATKFSYCLNQSHLFSHSIAQLEQLVLRTAKSMRLPVASSHGVPLTTSKRSSAPTLANVTVYLSRVTMRAGVKGFRRLAGIRQKWSLCINRSSWRHALTHPSIPISAPRGYFWADPFLHVQDGKTYCFVEEYAYSSRRGHISVLEITESGASNLGVAIKEDFHLSFPFLFRYNNELYMCPESSQSRQVRIYRSKGFPLCWELCSTPFIGKSMADSMLFERYGKWWMLSSPDHAEIGLYSSDSPLSKHWEPHPKNPIYVDASAGRNAGLILEGDRIFRVAQKQGFDQYGAGLCVFEILTLTDQDYEEHAVPLSAPTIADRYIGTHHLSTTGELTVRDCLERKFLA